MLNFLVLQPNCHYRFMLNPIQTVKEATLPITSVVTENTGKIFIHFCKLMPFKHKGGQRIVHDAYCIVLKETFSLSKFSMLVYSLYI